MWGIHHLLVPFLVNRDTPELRLFLVSQLILGTYKLLQLKFRGVALTNGNTCTSNTSVTLILNVNTSEAILVKVCLNGKTHIF